MPASYFRMVGRAAWPLAAALLVAAPGFVHAATVSASINRQLAPLVATAPHLAGPLRLLAAYGVPTSTRRSVEHNRRVGGATNSYHLLGNAIDVQRRPGVTHQALDAALRRAGYLMAESIDEVDHSHFAFLPGRITPVRVLGTSPAAPVAAPSKVLAEPRVAADLHGTLLIDGGGPPSAELTSAEPAGSSGALASAK
jgi:hypothetical protein